MTIEVPTLNKGHEASVLFSNTSLMMCSLVDDSCSLQRGVDLLLHVGRRKGNYILWIRSPDLDSDHAVVSMDVGKWRATPPPPRSLSLSLSLDSGEADTLFCPPPTTLDVVYISGYTLTSNLAPHFKIAPYAYNSYSGWRGITVDPDGLGDTWGLFSNWRI